MSESEVLSTSTHIIVVNYNAGAWLSRSLKSALKFSDGLITVVDNQSADGSVQATQAELSDQRLNWVLNSENVGFAAANNQVLRHLQSDFAVLMNPDCELSEDTLNAILNAFATHPDMGLASCRILNEDGSLQATCRRRFPTPWSAFVRLFQLHRLFPGNSGFKDFDYGDQIDTDQDIEFVEAISGAFMVVRKEALNDVGLLDEDYFMHCEDLDWCKRFELGGWKVGFIPSTFVTHAKGVSSQSRPIAVLWTLHKGMNRFFDKFYSTEYSLFIRYAVKLGIGMSFLARSLFTVLRGMVNAK